MRGEVHDANESQVQAMKAGQEEPAVSIGSASVSSVRSDRDAEDAETAFRSGGVPRKGRSGALGSGSVLQKDFTCGERLPAVDCRRIHSGIWKVSAEYGVTKTVITQIRDNITWRE